MSNFWKVQQPIRWKGKQYATSEHLYQSRKFIYDGADSSTRAYADIVRAAKTPYMAKLLSRMELSRARFPWQEPVVKLIAEHKGTAIPCPDWEKSRLDVMLQVLRVKFAHDEQCHRTLLSTEGSLLAEHTPTDKFWADGGGGGGENHLGRSLMRIREEILVEQMAEAGSLFDDDDGNGKRKTSGETESYCTTKKQRKN